MKKSRAVPLSLVSSLAAAAMAAGCGSHAQGWQTCVDRGSNVAVDRKYCDDEWGQTRPVGYVPHYHWYYYPRGYYGYGPAIGSPVPLGGTYGTAPIASVPMSRSGSAGSHSSSVRGGFGSTAAGHASSGGHASGGA
jgi:hypothetical protein